MNLKTELYSFFNFVNTIIILYLLFSDVWSYDFCMVKHLKSINVIR